MHSIHFECKIQSACKPTTSCCCCCFASACLLACLALWLCDVLVLKLCSRITLYLCTLHCRQLTQPNPIKKRTPMLLFLLFFLAICDSITQSWVELSWACQSTNTTCQCSHSWLQKLTTTCNSDCPALASLVRPLVSIRVRVVVVSFSSHSPQSLLIHI